VPPTRLKPVDEKPVTVSPGPLQRNDGVDTAVGFRNAEALREHYSKHGREFGQITRAEYLFMAQELRDTDADGQKVIVAFRPDGVVTKFDRRDGEFIAYNRNKVIRTFFKPGDGERYFHRQKNRQ
jgi:pyocin large subunit-like protein